MRIKVTRVGAWTIGCLAIAALGAAQPVSVGQDAKIQGVIASRNGAEMSVRTETGNVVVVLGDATKVEMKQGLVGARKKQAAVMALVPGLKVDVQGAGDQQGRLVATAVSFSAKDLQTAQEIQAGLNPTQVQLTATDQQVAANSKADAANQQQIQKVAGDQAALTKRFGELGDYDVKHEASVYFGPGKTLLSDQSKGELDTLAHQATALPGYLIQVEGFADSSGNAARNEQLSLERSQAVVDYLTEYGKVSPLHLLAPGAMGTSQPVASNETAAGRAENRRVAVKVLVNRGLSQP